MDTLLLNVTALSFCPTIGLLPENETFRSVYKSEATFGI